MLIFCTQALAGPREDAREARYENDHEKVIRITKPLAEKGEAWAQESLFDAYFATKQYLISNETPPPSAGANRSRRRW